MQESRRRGGVCKGDYSRIFNNVIGCIVGGHAAAFAAATTALTLVLLVIDVGNELK